METALAAALTADGEATTANVGDGRAYHIDDEVQQVTVDRSLAQKPVDSGEISLTEAETHPQRDVVSRALGTTESVDPDFYRVTVTGARPLCADGLTEEVPDGRTGEIVRSGDGLRAAADARDGSDRKRRQRRRQRGVPWAVGTVTEAAA